MTAPAPTEDPRPLRLRGAGQLRLAADAWGASAAPPVLLLHGGGQTRHAWGGTAAALAAVGWHAISLDLRGHGDSTWSPDGDYTLNAFVDDLERVVADLERPPVLVGASLGGLTSLLAVGEQRLVAAALVLVDVAPRLEIDGTRRVLAFMQAHRNGFATLDEAADAVASYLPHRPRPRETTGLGKNLRERDDGRLYWHWDPRFMSDRGPGDTSNVARLQAAARGITIPTLLVRGALSDVVSEEGAREFLALVPQARYLDVGDAAHMVAGDRNDVFTTAVAEFLHELEPTARNGSLA